MDSRLRESTPCLEQKGSGKHRTKRWVPAFAESTPCLEQKGSGKHRTKGWVPAFAGTTRRGGGTTKHSRNDELACQIAYERGSWYFSWKASRMLMNCGVRRARASLAILSGTPP